MKRYILIPAGICLFIEISTMIWQHRSHSELWKARRAKVKGDAEALVEQIHSMSIPSDAAERDQAGLRYYTWHLNVLPTPICLSNHQLTSLPWGLTGTFNLYAVACNSSGIEEGLKADLWNILTSMLEWKMEEYITDEGRLVSTFTTATNLAIYDLLLGRYHIRHHLGEGLLARLKVKALDKDLFECCCRKNTEGQSLLHTIRSVVSLLSHVCSFRQLLIFLGLVIADDKLLLFPILSLLRPSAAANPTTSAYLAETATLWWIKGGRCCKELIDFLYCTITGAPAYLLSAALLQSMVSYMSLSANQAVSHTLLRSFRATMCRGVLLALARFDYVEDPHWIVSPKTYTALNIATTLTPSEVAYSLNSVVSRLDNALTFLQEPAACIFGWTAQQAIDRFSQKWSRVTHMSNYLRTHYHTSTKLNCSEASHHQRKDSSCTPPPVKGPHYGLQALLSSACTITAETSKCYCLLADNTRWATSPLAVLQDTKRTLQRISSIPRSGADDFLKRKYNFVNILCEKEERSYRIVSDVTSARAPISSVLNSINLARSFGLNALPCENMSAELSCQRHSVGTSPPLVECLIDKALECTRTAPSMAVVASSRLTKIPSCAPEDVDPGVIPYSATVSRVMSTTNCYSLFPTPPECPWESISEFHFDIDVSRLRYVEYDGLPSSLAYLAWLTTSSPRIDARLWPDCVPLMRGGGTWSITFEHVFFRYPGSDVLVLRDVSFHVRSGATLGIIGGSGAGKSSILLLISRIYAPTEGRILINNIPIERYPVRQLRRCIGNCWQGSNSMKFFEHHSIEENIALGDLLSASASAVATVLHGVGMDVAIEQRPSGMKCPLNYNQWSSGELERLAISRSLMLPHSCTGVFLFDESGSAVDPETEDRILGLTSPCSVTRVIVSHRLASVRNADEIIVLFGGAVVHRGTWGQLQQCHSETFFDNLYDAQSKSASL